jgi:hypothetical protein
MSKNHGWIGVDLDGTLAHYDGWKGAQHIGEPVPAMVERVRYWIAGGQEVRIFTARLGGWVEGSMDWANMYRVIEAWCLKHLGRTLPVTATKDMAMLELWDDRAVCVERNTGRILGKNP